MADPPAAPAKGGKILGMPRTTGIIVIAGAALVVGYFVISKFSSSSKSGASGQGGGGQGGGGQWHGSGGPAFVRVIHVWQGHQPRQPHHQQTGSS